jgi:outer membrane translocation and assembly module TamA
VKSFRCLGAIALLLLTPPALLAQAVPDPEETPAPPVPASPETAVEDGKDLEGTVGEIRVTTRSIFDTSKPGEDKWVFRLADRLHRTTRPKVIERQLLLKPGDPYSYDAVEESERILRSNRYLYEAEIHPVPAADGRIDLEVETRDVWTLRAGVSFNRAGGENSTDFTLQDANFLGTGKDLTLWRISNVDRTSTLFRYRDPAVLGTRAQIEMSAADYSDGGSRRFEIERPFYSLDARWAAGFKTFLYERIDSLYDLGEVFQKIDHNREQLEAYLGFSSGLSHGATRRWLIGFNRELDKFSYPPGGDSTPLPPENRLFTYPWIGFEYVEDGFVLERQLDQIQRTENLGTQFQARVGYSTPELGAERSHLIASTRINTGWRPGSRQLLLAGLQGGSRWGSHGRENLLVGGSLRYYLRNFGKSVFHVSVEGALAEKLDPEIQLLLGGDTGLRGYPLRYLSGDRRWLVTLEQRFFSDREFFHVLHVGSAVFFDAGRAWFRDGSSGDQEVLRDVGIGLRLGSSRSSGGAMVHFDLAYPLDRQEGIESVQWLVSTSETF